MRILRHKFDGKFMLIPKAVFWDSRIRGLPMQVLGIILSQSDKWNGVTMKWLAAQCGASVASIKLAVKKLVECDYARPYKGVQAQYRYYTFSDTPMTEAEKAECDRPKRKLEAGFLPDTEAGKLAEEFLFNFPEEENVGKVVKTFNGLLKSYSFNDIAEAVDKSLDYAVGEEPDEPLGLVVNYLKKRCTVKSNSLVPHAKKPAQNHICCKKESDFLAEDVPDIPYDEIPF